MARKSVISKTILRGEDGWPTALRVEVEGFAPMVVNYDAESGAFSAVTPEGPVELSEQIAVEAVFHGLSQKLGDAGAIERVLDANGQEVNATPKAKFQAIHATFGRLVEGEWNARGEGDGLGGIGLLVRAVAEVVGLELAAAKEAVGKMDKKTQAAMRGDANIAPVIARMKAEDAAKKPEVQKIDTATLLAGLKKAA